MQFYVDGYRPGDPFIADAHPSVADRPGGLPEEVDVLVVGCGPAGLVLAAQLARFPEIRTAVVDRRNGPPQAGQADGVACRTVEMFEAFGLASRLVEEAYWVNGVTFWRPGRPTEAGSSGQVACRTSRTACRSSRTSSSTRRGCWPTCARTWSAPPAGCARTTG